MYYGLTPQQATELTAAEMASFIIAQRKHEVNTFKMLARIGYSEGMIASMALSSTRPKFEEVFQFPQQTEDKPDWNTTRNQMMVWAQNVNRAHRRQERRGKNERR